MRWRCMSARIFIYRPMLLWYAMRKESMEHISEGKRESIMACRRIAAELIEDIATTWYKPTACQMSGWAATWWVYQASMVPMLSLFCDSNRPDVVKECRQQVEVAISALSSLEKWSCTAKRSLEVVNRLYDASNAYHSRTQQESLPETAHIDMNIGQHRDTAEAVAETTPATLLSTSTEDAYFIGNFFDDLNWMPDQDFPMQGIGQDLAFLDYYDIGLEQRLP